MMTAPQNSGWVDVSMDADGSVQTRLIPVDSCICIHASASPNGEYVRSRAEQQLEHDSFPPTSTSSQDMPNIGDLVTVDYRLETSSHQLLDQQAKFSFTLGSGQVAPALDMATAGLARGCACEVRARVDEELYHLLSHCGAGKKGVTKGDTVLFRVKLISFQTPEGSLYSHSQQDRYYVADWLKSQGTVFLKKGQVSRARARYERALECIKFEKPAPGMIEHGLAANLCSNIAFTFVKQGDFSAGKRWALAALEVNPKHIKALYRLGTCCRHLHQYEEAQQALEHAAQLSNDPAIAKELAAVKKTLSQQKSKERAAYRAMFQPASGHE